MQGVTGTTQAFASPTPWGPSIASQTVTGAGMNGDATISDVMQIAIADSVTLSFMLSASSSMGQSLPSASAGLAIPQICYRAPGSGHVRFTFTIGGGVDASGNGAASLTVMGASSTLCGVEVVSSPTGQLRPPHPMSATMDVSVDAASGAACINGVDSLTIGALASGGAQNMAPPAGAGSASVMGTITISAQPH